MLIEEENVRYTYFVSFAIHPAESEGTGITASGGSVTAVTTHAQPGATFGNCLLEIDRPVSEMDQIEAFERSLERKCPPGSSVIILNFTLLSKK